MKLSKQKSLEVTGLVKDPRFLRLHSDPRFQRSFKRKLKIPIDSRFSHIFSDKRFSDPLSLDKRGKKLRQRNGGNGKKRKHALQEYYDCEDREHGEHKEDKDVDKEIPQCDDREISGEKQGDALASGGNSLFSLKKSKGNVFPDRTSKENDPRSSNERDQDSSFVEKKSPKPSDFFSERKSKENSFIVDRKMKQNHSISSSIDKVRDTTSGKSLDQKISMTEDRKYNESDSDEEESEGSILDDMQSEEISESSIVSSSSSESDSEEEEMMNSSSDEAEDEKVPTTLTETRRLALVNMDWDHIKAVDILAVMNSFVPKGGEILSVTVYPSEFGLEQMKEEEKRGPQIFSGADNDNGDEQVEDQEIINERLRRYEIAKLRYYYAVVECDSSATAGFLYKACDGMEFERSSNTLDLRFVPDDMEFTNDPRDNAEEVPGDYQAPTFETHALQHSKVKLTWDDDETERVKKLHQKFNADQLNEMDFKAYLASDASSDESEEEPCDGEPCLDDGKPNRKNKNSARDKYRALLLGSGNISADDSDNKDSDTDNNKDMEITFNSGLEDLSKRLMDKNKNKNDNETVWEAYLRKRKEKRKAQKQDKHANDETSADDIEAGDDPYFSHEQTNFDDPFFKSGDEGDFEDSMASYSDRELHAIPPVKEKISKKKAKLIEKKLVEEKSRAELELLLTDEHGGNHGVKGYNLKKKLKDKRKDKENISEKLPTVNYDDPRFSALFTSHRYAIDPTEPEFKRSAANLRNLVQKQQKHLTQVHEVSNQKGGTNDEDVKVTQKKDKQELSLMVKSLKRKVGTATK